MDYTLQQLSGPSGWMYSQAETTSSKTNTQEPLQEPVPFEDFQFSFGLDPKFAVPVPLDDIPSGPSTSSYDHTIDRLFQMDYEQTNEDGNTGTTQGYPTATHDDNNPLLDENDQKAFSQFLDAFFVDKDGQIANAEQMASQFSTMYDIPPPPPPPSAPFYRLNDGFAPLPLETSETTPYHVATSMFLPKSTRHQPAVTSIHTRNDDDDEYRRTSILQSLDQQKQLHQRLNRVQHHQQSKSATSDGNFQESKSPNAIFLQRSNQVAAPFITKQPTSISQRYHHQHPPYPPPERHQQHPVLTKHYDNQTTHHQDKEYQRTSSRSSSTPTRRNKSHKELLTEEEKRNNHIASEQKRRSTIRNGFKDLTDIVPTLKNLNNSKSTVLFKAVDYIKYLEKRNISLREKMDSLEVRIKVEGRVSDILMHSSSLQLQHPSMVPSQSSPTMQQSQSANRTKVPRPSSSSSSSSSSPSFTTTTEEKKEYDRHQPHSNNDSKNNNIDGMSAALLAHKSQQKQLMVLQEQLQYHQRLLTKEDDYKLKDNHGVYRHSISSSSTTSSCHSSPQSSDLYQHSSVASSRWAYDSNTKLNNPTVRMEVDNELSV